MKLFSELLGLGLEPEDLEFSHVCLRGIIVFICALVMVRCANRRFLSKLAAFDVILGFVLASMLSRSINGSAPFLPTLATGFVLVLVHRVIALLTYHSDFIGRFVKGEAQEVVRNGVPDRRGLGRHRISDKDLMEEARLNGQIGSMQRIGLATMERNGHISVLPRSEPSGPLRGEKD